MHTDDTIAAISTPLGQGGIGIVRLSGNDAIKITQKIFRPKNRSKLKEIPSHRIIYGHIINPFNKNIIDEVLVSIMKAPNTYTREDVVEINCHGGAVPLRRTLEIVLMKGARLAAPGEFTQRAFLNGRIDLAQAEAVLDVINSLTEQSQKTALNQLTGSLSNKIEHIRNKLIELTAFVEAHIDFPDEDIDPVSSKDMKKIASGIRKSIEKLIAGSRYGIILREGLKTAIVGRPNVGKSSLLNALLQQDRAIVTELPGTTRDVIEEYLNIEGLPVRIMDTAGIRDVKDIAEKEGVRRSFHSMEAADLIILVLDGSEVLHDTDMELIEKAASYNTIIAINKTDLTQKIFGPSFNDVLKNFQNSTVRISAKKLTGLKKLKDKILKTALSSQSDSSSASNVTNIRHVHAFEKALKSINSFSAGVSDKTSPEFLAVELRDALDAIGEITGITAPDDILNKIFSSFCIGK